MIPIMSQTVYNLDRQWKNGPGMDIKHILRYKSKPKSGSKKCRI